MWEGGGGAIKERCILVIRELLSCNSKLLRNFNHLAIESPGDLMGKHSETSFLWQIASSCFMYPSLVLEASISMALGHWVSFYFNFSHPSLFLSVLPSRPSSLMSLP